MAQFTCYEYSNKFPQNSHHMSQPICDDTYLLFFIIGTISFRLLTVSHFNKHSTPSVEKTIIAVRAFNLWINLFYLSAVRIIGCPCTRFERRLFNLHDEYHSVDYLLLYHCSDVVNFI